MIEVMFPATGAANSWNIIDNHLLVEILDFAIQDRGELLSHTAKIHP